MDESSLNIFFHMSCIFVIYRYDFPPDYLSHTEVPEVIDIFLFVFSLDEKLLVQESCRRMIFDV